MTDLPLSQVTLIAAALGVFFLIVAFYKSIFHKRQPPAHTALNPTAPPPSTRDDLPIKLADPFRQVPVDKLPLSAGGLPQTQAAPFYPSLPKPEDPSVSAFRQFNPLKDFDATVTSPKNDTTYEWE